MRFTIVAALFVHFAASAHAGTVFTIQAEFPFAPECSLTGRLDIDTTTGWINSLDLVLKPVTWGSLPFVNVDGDVFPIDPWPNNEVHFIRNTPFLPTARPLASVTDILWSAHTVNGFDQHTSGENWAELALRLPVASLVGYAGGPISHLDENFMGVGDSNFTRWSGITFQVNGDRETFPRWPFRGEVVPLVVPEPGTFVMALIGLVAFIVWSRQR